MSAAQSVFDAEFTAAGRIPDEPHNERVPRLVQAYILASPEFAKAAHAAVDVAVAAGAFDKTSRADVERRLADFQREIASRELALERQEAQRREETEAELLAQVDRRARRSASERDSESGQGSRNGALHEEAPVLRRAHPPPTTPWHGRRA